MEPNNHTLHVLDNSKVHYEANQPKLQWLLVLIPVAGIFALYTLFRIRNKKRRRKQLLQQEAAIPPTNTRNVIPHNEIFHHNNRSQVHNCSEISLVRLPQSGDVYINAEERNTHHDRRCSSAITSPPPIYSVCSPPKYEEVVDLRKSTTSPNIPFFSSQSSTVIP